jgi:Uma2 family endonuclease
MNQDAAELFEVGPFRADHLSEGDRYELSDGDAILCAPAGPDHAAMNLVGGTVLETDPAVEWAGVDAGFSPAPRMLRAPDVAVGSPQAGSSWIQGVPPFAVEFAGGGQNEETLQKKIADLLRAGTRLLWVVRLVGPRRVEVYEPGKPVRTVGAGAELTAPGILKNPVPVMALFDRDAAHEATLRNLLQRHGYESLDAVRAEGEIEGEARGEARGLGEGILTVLAARGLAADEATVTTIRAMQDVALLRRWLSRAAVVQSSAELMHPAGEPPMK